MIIENLLVKLLSLSPARLKNLVRIKLTQLKKKTVKEVILTNNPTQIDLVYSKFTLGAHNKCYLTSISPYLPLMNDSVENIIIDDYIANLKNQEDYDIFINELERILKINGIIRFRIQLSQDINDKHRHLWDTAPSWCNTKTELIHYYQYLRIQSFGVFSVEHVLSSLSKRFMSHSNNTFQKVSETKFLPSRLGKFTNKHNVYLGYADPSSIIKRVQNQVNDEFFLNRKLVTVAGSNMYLNFIHILRPSSLSVFDVNPLQVDYAKIVNRLITCSKSRKDFLSHLFSRNCSSIENLLEEKVDKKIFDRTSKICHGLKNFDKTIGAIYNSKLVNIGGLKCLKIKSNSYCEYLSVSSDLRFFPGTNLNYWDLKAGFLANEENFQITKKCLEKVDYTVGSISSNGVIGKFEPLSLAYVTNIGESDWLNGTLTHVDDVSEYINKLKHDNPSAGKDFDIAWHNEYNGFKEFVNKMTHNIWIIDSKGNIISMQTIRKMHVSTHEQLWNKLKPRLKGTILELIHAKTGSWGFHEKLDTLNFQEFINNPTHYDTIVLHLLISNGISVDTFSDLLNMTGNYCKRLIIMEKDPIDAPTLLYSFDSLIKLIRSVSNLQESQIEITYSGSGKVDAKYGISPSVYRNIIIVCDL